MICTYPDTSPDPIRVSSDHISGLLAVSSKYNLIGGNVPSVAPPAHPRVHDAIDVDAATSGPPRLLATSARSASNAEIELQGLPTHLSAQDAVGSTTHADASTVLMLEIAWRYVVHPAASSRRSQLVSRSLGLVGLLQSSTSISQTNSRPRRSRPPCAVTRNTPLVLGCNSCLDTPSSS